MSQSGERLILSLTEIEVAVQLQLLLVVSRTSSALHTSSGLLTADAHFLFINYF